MNGIAKKILSVVLFLVCIGLVYLIYQGIMEPVNFNKEKARREAVAIQRLKDIPLCDFYKKGEMKVVMQVGSKDDSLAMAHTEAVKKANRKITPADLYKMYLAGDKNLVFAVESKIAVKDTLFHNRTDFVVDSLKYIPFSGQQPVEMEATVRKVSGVDVPLFEARMPYRAFLDDVNKQLRINLDAERETQGHFKGLQVGSVTAPNNNAGNWE